MKIEMVEPTKPLRQNTLENFAEDHDLTMVVEQIDRAEAMTGIKSRQWIARFRHCEVAVGVAGLLSAYGVGATAQEAIDDYAAQISGKTLVYRAMNEKERRECRVPLLVKA